MATKPLAKQSYPSAVETTIVCDNGNCSAPQVHVAKNGKVTIKSPDFSCQVTFDTTDFFKGNVANPSPVTPTNPLELKIKDKAGTVGFSISGGPCVAPPKQTNVLVMSSVAPGGSVINSSNEIVIG